ncbi:MAG: SRPBCC family protein [Nocardiopsaceae bacterium]|nr:SRPBCC family protein [Nocardiopsaceae bacterium]
MGVVNVHERRFPVPADKVGALIDALATEDDPLWPRGTWYPIRLDRPLAAGPVGAAGGHGAIRYRVASYVPGQWVRFRFTRPVGFDGFHEFTVESAQPEGGGAILRTTLAMRTTGTARLSWPLMWRPMHDALHEDMMDRAEENLTGQVQRPARHSPYVRLLRGLFFLVRLPRRIRRALAEGKR